MFRYIAIVTDANIAGQLLIPTRSIRKAADIIHDAGRWHRYPDALAPHYATNGAVILDAPTVALTRIQPHETARITAHQIVREMNEGYGLHHDALLTTGPRGGVQRVY